MDTLNCFGTCLTTGERYTPKPDNDNWGVASETMTMAEAFQLIRRWKRQVWQELTKDPRLWLCTKHRQDRFITYEMEKCARWHEYGER